MADAKVDRADPSEPFTFEEAGLSLSGLWTEAARPIAVAAIAHGAGAGMHHPFMTGAAEGLAAGGVSVLRFNFPYMDAPRRRRPDPPPVLLETWEAAVRQAMARSHGLPVVAGGKSMGGRIASMLAAKQGPDFPGTALVFFGYPLHRPGMTDHLRDAHLPRIRVPMLFIQGTRDPLARFDLMEALVERLGPIARLHVVTDGDHSFHVRGGGDSDRDNGRALGQIAGAFVRTVVGA